MRATSVKNNTAYVVMNATSPIEDQTLHAAEWLFAANSFATTVSIWLGDDRNWSMPERMVLLDLDNYDAPPGTFTVQRDWVVAVENGSMTIEEFHQRWRNTSTNQTQEQIELAEHIDAEKRNVTYPNEPDD